MYACIATGLGPVPEPACAAIEDPLFAMTAAAVPLSGYHIQKFRVGCAARGVEGPRREGPRST